MKDNITIVICSCDSYEDAWMPLFTLMAKYWKNLSYKIVLNTETKTFNFPGLNIISPQPLKNVIDFEKISWSKRLKMILSDYVDTELVLIYLDDFYLQSEVNQISFDKCVNLMLKNPRIGNIQLFPCPPGYTVIAEYPWLVKRKKGTPYYFNLQVGLWRTKRLIHFLRDHESPWYFERWGSLRGLYYNDEVLSINPDMSDNIIFDYNPLAHGLTKGKWRPNTVELFNKEQINIDINIRGVYKPDDSLSSISRLDYLKKFQYIFRSLLPY